MQWFFTWRCHLDSSSRNLSVEFEKLSRVEAGFLLLYCNLTVKWQAPLRSKTLVVYIPRRSESIIQAINQLKYIRQVHLRLYMRKVMTNKVPSDDKCIGGESMIIHLKMIICDRICTNTWL